MDNTGPTIGITLGEATGIGPELVVKSLQRQDIRSLATWVIAGDKRILQQGEDITSLKLDVVDVSSLDDVIRKNGVIYFIDLANLRPDQYKLGELSIDSGHATGETLKYILNLAKKGIVDGVMYAPLNKEALHRGGHHFQDEIHFFANEFGYKDGFSEINVMEDLWVTRVTSHIPIKNVSANISREKVEERIQFAHNTLTRAGIVQPKIVVSALNPHAGEGGMIGREEIESIIPAIDNAQRKNINVHGPYPADTLFLRLEKDRFDCLLAMYHDQAQTGMKLLGFHKGVTMSGGLPIPLTTPAHGTAFDIAGKNAADPGATLSAIKMAVKMARSNKKQSAHDLGELK